MDGFHTAQQTPPFFPRHDYRNGHHGALSIMTPSDSSSSPSSASSSSSTASDSAAVASAHGNHADAPDVAPMKNNTQILVQLHAQFTK